MKAYVVGGFVRDLLLRIPNLDVDLVVEGDGIAYAQEMAALEGGRVRPHQKFGTAVVVLPGGFKVDVATARVEYYVGPAALPTVESSSLRQDLYRRDFTINTLALRLDPAAFGEIIDYFGAQRDLKERVVRILHSLSFVEDPTRILRAARFSERFGFAVSRHTRNLIQNAVRLDLVGRLPRPRLNTELELILKEDDPVAIFRRLAEWKLAPQLHPSLPLDRRHLERMEETEGVLSWFSLLYLEDRIDPWMVHFLALLDPLGGEEAVEYGSVRKVRQVVEAAKREADRVVREMVTATAVSRKFIHDLLSGLPAEVILYIMIRSKHPDIKRYISMYFTQLRTVKPMLTGEDLLALGYREGPLFRRILDALLEARFLGRVSTREDEEAFVLEHFQKG
jgi:tRNA nucleotidyltransferase (CCA-adding enzyme)